MKKSVFILVMMLLPVTVNAQFWKKALNTVGEVLSDNKSSSDNSNSSSSRSVSPINSRGEVKVPAIVFSNPSAAASHERSAGSIGAEWKEQTVRTSLVLNDMIGKSYAGNDYSFVITNPRSSTLTIYSVNGSKDDLEIPQEVSWKGKNYLVTTIGAHSFQSRTIKSFDAPISIIRIGYEAFRSCKMQVFRIPSSVKYIDARAFADCRKLRTVYIPASVESIGYGIFAACIELENIIVDENNPYFKSVDGVLYNKNMTELIQYPAGKKDRVFNAPKTLASINREAFRECWYLEDVILPDGLMYLAPRAFEDARIHNIYLPASIRMIDSAALAFGEWIKLGEYQNTNVFVVSNKPLPADNAFYHYDGNIKSKAKVYVKKGTRRQYLSADSWSAVEYLKEVEFIKK